MTLLMTPGPVPLSEAVRTAMEQPAEFHHDASFYGLLDECRRRLAGILDGDPSGVFVLPGSGRVGLEAALSTTLHPGDRTLHLVNGLFGGWTATIAERVGADVEVVATPFDRGVPAERAWDEVARSAREGRPYRLVTVAHCETSTGQLTRVADLVAGLPEPRPLVLVDAISSVPGTEFSMRSAGVDLCVLASQKALGAPIGLSIVAASGRARSHWSLRERPPGTWALDLSRWSGFDAAEGAKPYPVVPSTHLVRALAATLRELDVETGTSRSDRYRALAERARATVSAAGLEVFGRDPSPTVTPVALPEGVGATDVVQHVLARADIRVVGGMGPIAERIVRIPHMGIQGEREAQRRTLRSILRACRANGGVVDVDAGMQGFDTVAPVADPPGVREHRAAVVWEGRQ